MPEVSIMTKGTSCHFWVSFLLSQVTKISVPNVVSVKDLTMLDTLLASSSYIGGYEPSCADKAIYDALRGVGWPSSMSHLTRWYRHIKSFSPAELEAFPTGVPTCNNLPLQVLGLLSTNNHGVDIDHKVRNWCVCIAEHYWCLILEHSEKFYSIGYLTP
jgi:hypothetical protein